MDKSHNDDSLKAFTLVELAIVLVIIGLIVSGVLVGNDLIQSARIKAAMGQINSYSAAVNTFRLKYSALPGDIASGQATIFGMQPRSGVDGHGDNDGSIESCDVGAQDYYNSGFYAIGCESVLFWRDLSFAGLIDGSFSAATDALTQVNAATVSNYFPRSKLGETVYVTVTRGVDMPMFFHNLKAGRNFFILGGLVSSDAAGVLTSTPHMLTPLISKAIDEKFDDGTPFLGTTEAVGGNNNTAYVGSSSVTCGAGVGCVCDQGVGNYFYNTGSNYADLRFCHMAIGMQ